MINGLITQIPPSPGLLPPHEHRRGSPMRATSETLRGTSLLAIYFAWPGYSTAGGPARDHRRTVSRSCGQVWTLSRRDGWTAQRMVGATNHWCGRQSGSRRPTCGGVQRSRGPLGRREDPWRRGRYRLSTGGRLAPRIGLHALAVELLSYGPLVLGEVEPLASAALDSVLTRRRRELHASNNYKPEKLTLRRTS